MTIPIRTSPDRSRFGPRLALTYDSAVGNGPFGIGWSLSLASITRKTETGLPQDRNADESDVFILSGAEDLVPLLDDGTGRGGRSRTIDRDACASHCETNRGPNHRLKT
jgi:Salmonella virulence plasmid 65kDa B protein